MSGHSARCIARVIWLWACVQDCCYCVSLLLALLFSCKTTSGGRRGKWHSATPTRRLQRTLHPALQESRFSSTKISFLYKHRKTESLKILMVFLLLSYLINSGKIISHPFCRNMTCERQTNKRVRFYSIHNDVQCLQMLLYCPFYSQKYLGSFCLQLRWFPHNIRAIMEKIKLAKNPLSMCMVIFWIKVRISYRDLSSEADPARENWTWSYPYFS